MFIDNEDDITPHKLGLDFDLNYGMVNYGRWTVFFCYKMFWSDGN